MMFDAKLFTVLVFVIINFLILFTIKTRTTIVISLIIAHLVAVLFFSLSISNYNSFKEIVLALIVYSMVILFLISNYNPIYLAKKENIEFRKLSITTILASITVILSFVSIFFIAQNIAQISESVQVKRTVKEERIFNNPIISASHPAHIAVKKNYLGKKFEDKWSNKTTPTKIEISKAKRSRIKEGLSDNFLLKRSSDVILIIVAISASLLLLGTKTKSNS